MTKRLATVLAVVGLGLPACGMQQLEVQAQIGGDSSTEAERAFLERLRVEHPEVELDPSGYPVFSPEAQREAIERYRELLLENRIDGLREQTPPHDWLAVAYHGDILDANYEPIKLDEQTIRLIQDSMFELFRKSADPERLVELTFDPEEAYFTTAVEGPLLLAVRSALLRALLDMAPLEMAERYSWRLTLLHQGVFMLPEWSEIPLISFAEEVAVPVLLRDLIVRFALPAAMYLPNPGSKTYNADCRAQGVPIPPNWPDPEWKKQGELPFGLNFAGGRGRVEVYAYEETGLPGLPGVPGACIALPRWVPLKQPDGSSKDGIGALGIICQSAKTGRACFWDNRQIKPGKLYVENIAGENIKLDIDKIRNGSSLASDCTHCHRGENAFLIHPGTALDIGRPKASQAKLYNVDPGPSRWYTPMGQADWRNPGPLKLPTPRSGSSCTGCHKLPEVRRLGYCGTVLAKAASQTMPSITGVKPAGWPAPPGSAWREHTLRLFDICRTAHP